jgi:hypothetical protein
MGIPRAFIVNIDELGFTDDPDARCETIVVPNDCPDGTIPVPFDRNTKRATMVTGIVVDGTARKPLIIVLCKTLETDLIF